MLQQLICLWFDDKLCGGTSRCALYTEMLELFFDWHKKKHSDDPLFTEMMKKSEDLKNVKLPLYLRDSAVCKSHSYIIHDVSRLAYETLFNNTKETSLSFDSLTFERLKISKEVKSCCLKLGILSEDKCQSLSASRSRKSAIAFVHKSFQEYLAAVYIAIRCDKNTAPSADSEHPDLTDHCVLLIRNLFSKCTTLDEILEQENVLIMLCGLEPQIASFVSKYIYGIVTRDKRILQHRRTIDNEFRHTYLISTVQKCIFNCIEEMQACIQTNLNLGDIIVQSTSDCERLCKMFERQFVSPDSVIAFSIYSYKTNEYLNRVLNYLSKFQRLEAIYFLKIDEFDDEYMESVCDLIEGNTSSLKALSLSFTLDNNVKHICRTILRRLPDMSLLVALKMQGTRLPHKDVISLCTFLSSTSHLEQISITVLCEPNTNKMFDVCRDQHEVDLFKQQQLQYLELDESVTVTRVNTSNLEILEGLLLKSTNYVEVFDNLSTANKLTKLHLKFDIYTDRDPQFHTITDKMITLLPLLHQLRELILERFTFTDNIMNFPSKMKSIELIELIYVRMSLTTWQQFVDSLPLIPLPVKVKRLCMFTTKDGVKRNPDIFTVRRGEKAAARQYVREQEMLFNVGNESDISFEFSTRK